MANKLKAIGVGVAALGVAAYAILSPMLEQNEGTVLVDYYDPLGIPTACRGHTGPDVHVGQKRSKAECDAIERADVDRIWAGVDQCLTNKKLPPNVKAAIASLAFSVGPNAVCHGGDGGRPSRLILYMNDGRIEDGCREFPKWKYAGGKVLRGIVLRREREMARCLGEKDGSVRR